MAASTKNISAKDIKVPAKKVVVLPSATKNFDEPNHQKKENILSEVSESGALVAIDDQLGYEHLIRKFIGDHGVVRAKNGKVYLRMEDRGNDYHVSVGSTHANLFLRRQAMKQSLTLRDKDLKEVNDMISAYAEMELEYVDIYLRVAPYSDGIEIDLGDEEQKRVRITPGHVEQLAEGSETLFYRSKVTMPFDQPAKQGDFRRIKQYLNNLRADMQLLIIAWISYTLAHPKINTTKYVHLVLIGSQGSGKSFLCRLIAKLVDPCAVGLQVLPRNTKDLIVAAQNTHVLLYDNVRKLSQSKSDDLCVASTGGAMSTKKLYTDDDQSISYLHVALVLNGIFDFITEPDLASRSLILYLEDMNESERLSEVDLEHQLELDMPGMLIGLFQLIADIFKAIPRAKGTYPERMIDFSQWLAAMEIVDNVPEGVYQQAYSESLREAQLNTLLENELAAAVYRFADKLSSEWEGTPTGLLHELNDRASFVALRSSDWPKSPESLSKRLRTLRAALASQGVSIRFWKSNDRMIAITTARIEENY